MTKCDKNVITKLAKTVANAQKRRKKEREKKLKFIDGMICGAQNVSYLQKW